MSKLLKMTRPEYEIALQQLARLNEISRDRMLTTDEVRMYDMLVKNLRLIEEDPTVIEARAEKPKELTVAEALELLMPEDEGFDLIHPEPEPKTRKSDGKEENAAKIPKGKAVKPKAE